MPECFFKHLGNCEGRLVKAHLIPKQRIKREIRIENSCGHVPSSCPFGAACADCGINELNAIVWDERVWAWMCGGLTGIGGHHGQFDAVQIEIERDDLPESLEEYAREYGLEWSLEADYGAWRGRRRTLPPARSQAAKPLGNPCTKWRPK